MTTDAPPVLWRETVRPDWTDYNGHLNVAYYVLIFDHATDAFHASFGVDDAYRATGSSTFAVEQHVNYIQELMEGTEVECTTQLLDFDEKRVHFFHEMRHAAEGFVAATSEIMTVHVDMSQRRVAPMKPDMLDRLSAIREAHSVLPRPANAGRVIGIRRK